MTPMTPDDFSADHFGQLKGLAEVWNKLDEMYGSLAEIAAEDGGSTNSPVNLTISPVVNEVIVIREIYAVYNPIVTVSQLVTIEITRGGDTHTLRRLLDPASPSASFTTPMRTDENTEVSIDLPASALVTGHIWAVYQRVPV